MRLDPRTKLLILAVTSVSVFMNKSIAVECVLAGIPLVLLSVSGNLKRTLKYAAFFLALLLIQLFIVPRLPVTFGGIVYMFAVYIRKLLPCFMLGSFLLATTGVSKFLAAITKLRLSKGLTIALAITLRYFPTMSVAEELLLNTELTEENKDRARHLLKEFGLYEYRDAHPSALSGGQKQRLAIACAIFSGRRILILDEPTSGLDGQNMRLIAERLKSEARNGRTILVITHDRELIESCCDNIVEVEKRSS